MRVDAPVYVPLAQRHDEKEPAAAETLLLDLDLNVIRLIMESLHDIRDVISCIMSCRIFRMEAVAGKFLLDLRSISDEAIHASSASSSIAMSLMVKSLAKYLPLVTSLDLSNLPLDSNDVDTLLSRLPHLHNVCLSGCKQLSSKSSLFRDDLPLRPPNLRELDLQRCFQLTAGCLKSILTSRIPWNLQSLCLSHLFFLPKGPLTATTPTLRMLALNNCTQMDFEGLLFVTSSTPNLTYLGLGGSTFCSEAHRQQQPVSNEEDALLQGAHPIAMLLHSIASSLPLLEKLELTFIGSDIIHSLQKAIGPRVQVVDLSTSRGVSNAVQCLRLDHCNSHLSTMMRCAAKCKSSSRKSITPLHLAAHLGDIQMANDLISLGALVDARDASGAVPIFVACEQGQTEIVRALMTNGADFTIGNSDGETCLYIAALKGHLGCVEALLSASSAWQDCHYSDGWSPLHAACIGWSDSHQKHLHIARLLMSTAYSLDELYKMLSSVNRYGQTVIHLAARKSPVLLVLFFSQVADNGNMVLSLATQLDANRCSPIDIAVQNCNNRAVEILEQIVFSTSSK